MLWKPSQIMRKKVLIIAEAGVNHNGDIDKAFKLVDIAANSGADYVKFQTFKAEKISTINAQKANYQKNKVEETQFEMLKKLELTISDHLRIVRHCNKKNIKFLSTAFDLDGIDFLNNIGIDIFKIPSGEIDNYLYLKKVSETDKPIILSTGMSTEKEIFKAIEVLRKYSKSKNEITLLHCNSAYPTPMEDVNLLSMNYLKKKFNVDVGYSDHTQGIDISLAAVAIGATVIEKHFTIDKSMEGPDHSSSLDPNELKMMIKGIRNIEISLQGHSSKTVTKSEMVNKIHVRKSICYNENLKKGEILTEDKVIMLRPGDGISPMKVTSFIGKKCNKDLVKYDKLKKTDFD